MIGEPVCVAPTGDVCGEGAVWHAAHNAVYWTDINRFLIHRLNLANSSVRTWLFDEPVTSLALTDREDVLVVVLGSRVILWEPAKDAHGSSGEAGGQDGILIRLDPDAQVTTWRKGVGIANTLAWSPDRRRFYFGDTLANVIWVYDYDSSTGAISDERPFLQGFARGFPDGSTVDSESFLWTLFVTTASAEAPRGNRLAGSLFSLQTEVRGQPENCFRFYGCAR